MVLGPAVRARRPQFGVEIYIDSLTRISPDLKQKVQTLFSYNAEIFSILEGALGSFIWEFYRCLTTKRE